MDFGIIFGFILTVVSVFIMGIWIGKIIYGKRDE